MNIYTIILIILLSIFSLSLIFYLSYIFKRMYTIRAFSTNGLAIFKIDYNQKIVVRLSNKKMSGSLNFDSLREGIKINDYVDFNDFLSYFDKNSQKEIIKFLDDKKNNAEIICKMSDKGIKTNSLQRIFKNKFINFKDVNLKLKFYLLDEQPNNYVCVIHWKFKNKTNRIHRFKTIKSENEIVKKTKGKFFLGYALSINSLFYVDKITESDLKKITKILDIQKYKGFLYVKNGILNILIIVKSQNRLKKYIKHSLDIMEYICKNNIINPFFNKYSILTSKGFEKKKFIQEYNDKCKYLIHNLENNKDSALYSTWFLDNNVHLENFEKYLIKVNDYENKNNFQKFIKETIDINLFKKNKPSNIKILKNIISGLTDEDFNFFKNIPWYKLIYTKKWNNFLIESCGTKEQIILISNEYDLYNNIQNYTRKNTILMVNVNEIDFDYHNIDDALDNIIDKSIKIGFYIEKIDEKLINYISNNKINTFIIGKNISSKFQYDSYTYLKLFNLIKIIKNIKNSLVIYEGLDEKLDDYFIKKLNIEYNY
ncbi:MHO_4530 family protein [Mycoplasmopsis lipofaciens]|uniref:MHO_4530 family protein n=1 Tax=Mycoplasmopsis lipofaciens TaxID=114884 RepID=UPI000484CEFF|nr:hypothetical protein [Mycoplasmopsis lipofaciens]